MYDLSFDLRSAIDLSLLGKRWETIMTMNIAQIICRGVILLNMSMVRKSVISVLSFRYNAARKPKAAILVSSFKI